MPPRAPDTNAGKQRDGDRASRILAAADELFSERGFDAVSVNDVAVLASVNKALVFYYFGSKEGLFAQVIEPYYEAHREALESAFAGSGDVSERLHRTLDAYLDFIDGHRRYARLVQGQIAASTGERLDPERRSLEPLFAWTQDALAEVAPAEGPRAARHLYVTFSGAVINYFTYAPVLAAVWGTDPLSVEAVAERREHLHWLVEAVLGSLRSPAAQKEMETETSG